MLTFYSANTDGRLTATDTLQAHGLVYLINPSPEEIQRTADLLRLPATFLTDSLDRNERPRIEHHHDNVLMVLNAPTAGDADGGPGTVPYRTHPLGLILTPQHTLVVSRIALPLLDQLLDSGALTPGALQTRFMLQLFRAVAQSYDRSLLEINQQISGLQRKLRVAYHNQELFALINLNKSLVFFSTALSAMTILYKRIMAGHDLAIDPADRTRMAEILVDLEQSAEITEIRREGLSNLMDAYAAIIHNNLNGVLKLLTTLAILLVIPTMVGSVFSMNVALPYEEEWISTIVIGVGMVLVSAALMALLYKKKYLRL